MDIPEAPTTQDPSLVAAAELEAAAVAEVAEVVQDISREGVTLAKITHLLYLLVGRFNYAIAKVSSFGGLDIDIINQRLQRNFRAVILDVDECLAPHHGDILPENVEKIVQLVTSGIKVVIFSNMKASERYQPVIDRVMEKCGYEIKVVMSRHAKPDRRGFEECRVLLALEEGDEVLMIGDNPVTDGGSVRAGIPFARIKPVRTLGESLGRRIKRSPQVVMRAFYSLLSDIFDVLGRRPVLKDRDFLRVDEDQ